MERKKERKKEIMDTATERPRRRVGGAATVWNHFQGRHWSARRFRPMTARRIVCVSRPEKESGNESFPSDLRRIPLVLSSDHPEGRNDQPPARSTEIAGFHLCFTELYRVFFLSSSSSSSSSSGQPVPTFDNEKVLLASTAFYWVLPSFIGFYWFLLGFT